MQVNRYINGEKAHAFSGTQIENEVVKEAVAQAFKRAQEAAEKA